MKTAGNDNILKKNIWIRGATYALIIFCLVFVAMIFKAFLNGRFHSVETFQEYISGFGIFAPMLLVLIQALQVIIPILPGFLGCAVGAIMFGSALGFWCNYIGIDAGSVAAFCLAKRFGKDFVKSLFPEGKYEKWSNWAAHSKCYTAFLFAAMVLPLFPDDFFCYFSGLTEMKTKKFLWIIILGKPWCILAYSLGFALIK